MTQPIEGIEILGEISLSYHEILTEDALKFVRDLHRMFNKQRKSDAHSSLITN